MEIYTFPLLSTVNYLDRRGLQIQAIRKQNFEECSHITEIIDQFSRKRKKHAVDIRSNRLMAVIMVK